MQWGFVLLIATLLVSENSLGACRKSFSGKQSEFDSTLRSLFLNPPKKVARKVESHQLLRPLTPSEASYLSENIFTQSHAHYLVANPNNQYQSDIAWLKVDLPDGPAVFYCDAYNIETTNVAAVRRVADSSLETAISQKIFYSVDRKVGSDFTTVELNDSMEISKSDPKGGLVPYDGDWGHWSHLLGAFQRFPNEMKALGFKIENLKGRFGKRLWIPRAHLLNPILKKLGLGHMRIVEASGIADATYYIKSIALGEVLVSIDHSQDHDIGVHLRGFMRLPRSAWNWYREAATLLFEMRKKTEDQATLADIDRRLSILVSDVDTLTATIFKSGIRENRSIDYQNDIFEYYIFHYTPAQYATEEIDILEKIEEGRYQPWIPKTKDIENRRRRFFLDLQEGILRLNS